jgi:hypothetical protein
MFIELHEIGKTVTITYAVMQPEFGDAMINQKRTSEWSCHFRGMNVH